MSGIRFHFDEDGGYLFKLGKAEYLKDIQEGNLRFNSLESYRSFDSKDSNVKNAIQDEKEGTESFILQDKNTSFILQHPLLGNKPIDITQSIVSMSVMPNTNRYISCFSYFTYSDCVNKTIFDDKILENPDWDSVLLILDSNDFISNLEKACKGMSFRYGKVTYKDFSNGIENADEFVKSKEYEYQKEYRISIVPSITTKDSVTIPFEKVESVIIPAKEFRESFILENQK